MKKIMVVLLALTLVFGTSVATGDDSQSFTICDGTSTNAPFPFYVYYCDSQATSQFIYPASMLAPLTKGDLITSMTFYISQKAAACGCDWQFYVMPIDTTTLTGIIDYSQATLVYDGPLDTTKDTMTITFSTPYEYQGGNLFCCSRNKSIGDYKGVYFYGTTGNTNASFYNFVY